MMNREFSAALAAFFLSQGTASAQQCNVGHFGFFIHLGTGTVQTISETWNGSGWDLSYAATVNGSGLLTVYFRKYGSCGDRISSIRIVTAQGTGSGGSVVVNVAPHNFPTGLLGHIGTIEKLAGTPPLAIGVEDIGEIGSGGVSADIIGTIVAKRNTNYLDYSGDILGPITTSSGSITNIFAGRHIRGHITSAGSIEIVSTVGGDVGQPFGLVNITVSGNGDEIAWVRGRSIYANITTSNTATVRGEVDQITTTVGDFVGSLTTFVMEGTPPGQSAIHVTGNLDADIDTATIKRPVVILGNINPGASILMRLGSNVAGPVTVTGSLGGLIGGRKGVRNLS